MIKSKKLNKHHIINHAFFNKNNGFSKGIYKSLNCGKGSQDNKEIIKKNLRYVANKISKRKNNIVLLHQIHSSKFLFIKKFPKKKIIGDALITNVKNLPIGILTADCAPVLILDAKEKMIAAVHAGWKGAYKNIVIKVIKKLVKLGSKKKNIIVAIGPCIGLNNYEVKKEFKDKFLRKNKKNSIFFAIKKKRIFFNLTKFIHSQLISFGILKIDVINKNTFNEKNNFFSARRSIKKNEPDYGRNISVIMLK